MATITAVQPPGRYGALELEDNIVTSFQEKPQGSSAWINGGYFVIEPDFFDLIDDDSSILEHSPLERASQIGELMSFQHNGFWQCMDTKRDRDSLESMWESGNAPWKI